MYGNPHYGNPHYVTSNYGADNAAVTPAVTPAANGGWSWPTLPWQEGYEKPEWTKMTPKMKDTFVGAGSGLIGGWLAGRQAAKGTEAASLIQQQVAMAEIAAKQQQAAAMRNMILIITLW